jgi:sulfate/thiosulfate transport system substrate-binding protein
MNRNALLPILSLLLVGAVALAASGCGSTSSSAATGGGGGGKLSLVAYSTPQEVYAKVIPAFQKTAAGQGVSFSQSYGPSGDQARAVVAGLPADVVAFSLAPDVKKLVDAGLVDPNWASAPYHGFVSKSVVVIVVRKGNPKDIRTWDDLLRPGVQVLIPNPFTSGGARWDIMAAAGARGDAYLAQLYKHVVVQDKSARDSVQTFLGGKGDALLAYENEAITAQKKGGDVDYVIPDQTISIENPAAVIKSSKHSQSASAFLEYLRSPAAQKVFAAEGYRPVIDGLVDKSRYPTPSGLFTIAKFGGWDAVMKKYFDPSDSVMARIERGLGVATK